MIKLWTNLLLIFLQPTNKTVQWLTTAQLPLHPLVLLEISGLPSTIRTCDLRLRRLLYISAFWVIAIHPYNSLLCFWLASVFSFTTWQSRRLSLVALLPQFPKQFPLVRQALVLLLRSVPAQAQKYSSIWMRNPLLLKRTNLARIALPINPATCLWVSNCSLLHQWIYLFFHPCSTMPPSPYWPGSSTPLKPLRSSPKTW